MRVIEFVLLWEGFISLVVGLGTYIVGKWWKYPITRFIVALLLGILALCLHGIINSIFHPSAFNGDLTYLIPFAIVMTYGAYAFIRVTQMARADK
jgi:hypothetical protein